MLDKYIQALHEAQAELRRIEQRREVLGRLIQNLKELSENDAYELEPPPGYVPQGLTEEIRTILTLTTVPLTPPEIRDSLVTRGFKGFSSPKNLLISVHTVLSRLHDARELDISEKDGKPAYKKDSTPDYLRLASVADLASPKVPEDHPLRRLAAKPRQK